MSYGKPAIGTNVGGIPEVIENGVNGYLIQPRDWEGLYKLLLYIKDHPNAGAVGCRILLADGSLDKACKRSFPTVDVSFYRMCGLSKLFPNSPRFNRYNLSYLDECEIHSIDCLVGAYMLMPSSLYKEVGGLDEDYFMYGEDIDLCYKIKKLGYDVIYYGKNTITHYKGASGKNKRLLTVVLF